MTTHPSGPDARAITRLNPSTWNAFFRFDQAQLRPAPAQLLTIAGQGPIDADGQLQHEGDVAGQLRFAMQNIADLLTAAGMDFLDVQSMTIYVTDMAAALAGYAAITEVLDAAGATPPATLVGVASLAVPGMAVEIAAVAGR
jgi:enamine deaminase RidA (YjgF/YER057c/UK114 family)